MGDDLVYRHPRRQRRGDDRAGGSAGDEIEVVAQPELAIAAVPGAERRLEVLQDPERENAAQAAAVEGEDPLRALAREVFIPGQNAIRHDRYLAPWQKTADGLCAAGARSIDHWMSDEAELGYSRSHSTSARWP